MTSTILSHQMSNISHSASHPADEDLINKSLLDSVDAQGDAEPPSSSDSEAAAPHGIRSSSSHSSSDSPELNYFSNLERYHQQQQLQQQQQSQLTPDSPSFHPFALQEQMYLNGQPSMYSTGQLSSDFPGQSMDRDNGQQISNNFDSGPYRAASDLNNFFNSRPRQNTAPSASSLYASDSGFMNNMGLNAADIFGAHQSMQLQGQQQLVDGVQNLRGLDYATVSQQKSMSKPVFNNLDPFGAAALLQSQQLGKSQQQQSFTNNANAAYINGLMSAHSQTPYGPHLTNGVNASNVLTHTNVNAARDSSNTAHEEISTIFVVGFPDDMQEREFQNMFTFSTGFEAATLKIPNKDSTAYGTGPSGSSNTTGLRTSGGLNYSQSAYNDPYSLVGYNQGGYLVDNRDASSWQASLSGDEMAFGRSDGHQGPGSQPPRKQIIGFAKFRTRSEALAARDALQGRRVDFDKGAVLKAEMAKKNLHTKRGVGPTGGAPVPSNGVAGGNVDVTSSRLVGGGIHPDMLNLTGLTALNMGMLSPTVDTALSAREREIGALSAIGLGSMPGQRRDRLEAVAQEEERESRRRRDFGSMGTLSGMLGTTRGARERAEEEERERERRRKEKESNSRLRSSSLAFDAFQQRLGGSIQTPSMFRNPSIATLSSESSQVTVTGNPLTSSTQSLLSPVETPSAYPFQPLETSSQGSSALQDNSNSGNVDVWPPPPSVTSRRLGSVNSNGALRNIAIGASPLSPSSRPASPSDSRLDSLAVPQSISQSSSMSGQSDSSAISGGLSPIPDTLSLSNSQRFGGGSRPFSPTEEPTQEQQPSLGQGLSLSSISTSSASSVTSSRNSTGSIEGEMSQSMANMNVGSSDGGLMSPQLPSPGSGSSGHRGNSSDQNPPINTLYVGNLPTTPSPGYPPNYLEESLRALFQRCPGYRKLCFRQKSNGPMCFVEFEDVVYATKALNELYGQHLNGLVKGGIRLSYSKNPLGVRTPTTNGNSTTPQQQTYNGYSSMQALQESFSPRQPNSGLQPIDFNSYRSRRELNELASPTSPVYQATSPPRFFSPPPAAFGYGLSPQQTSGPSFARALSQGFGQTEGSTFSPFGLPPSPRQNAEAGDYIHSTLSTTPSIEAARAC